MSPSTISDQTRRQVEPLRDDQDLGSAARQIVASAVPALPVLDAGGDLKGIFGEREFIGALFPRYLGELIYAAFVPRTLEDRLEKRQAALAEPVSQHMNTEHIDVTTDCSDTELAEIFLHHRVLIVPVLEQRRLAGIVTRWEFFKALVERVERVT